MTEKTLKKRVLIVDDMESWRKYHFANLKEIFGETMEFEFAESARKAYDMVYNNISTPYDIIISDLQMENDFEPEMAGEWFVKRVKELNQYFNCKIFIVSASYNIQRIADDLGVFSIRK